jgi:hypothetical protein
VKEIVVMFEEPNVNVRNVDDVEKHTAVEFEKSQLKLLIDKYENMRVENESTIMIGQSETDVSCAKPKCVTPSGRPEFVLPVVRSAKPVQASAKSS